MTKPTNFLFIMDSYETLNLDHMGLNRPGFLKIAAVGGCCR